MKRKEIYSKIKEMNLSQEIFDTFGDNFTRLSNITLEDFIASKVKVKPKKVYKSACSNKSKSSKEMQALIRLVSTLRSQEYLDEQEAAWVLEAIE